MSVTTNSGPTGVEDVYRQSLEENMRILAQFPVALQSSLILSETMSPAENASTDIRVKSAVSECLNAISAICRLSADLDLLSEH